MKKIYSIFVLLLIAIGAHAAIFTSVQTGNFSAASTWDKGSVPTMGDDVIISAGHTVSMAGATNITIVNLNVNGVVNFISTATGQLTITGDLTVNLGGKLEAYGGTTGKFVNLAGNLINNGIVDFKYASTSLKGLVLNGSTTQTISGSGTAIFSYLSVDNVAGIVLSSPITITRTLTLTNGELENNSTITMDNKLSPVTANFATIARSSASSITGTSVEIGSTTGAALYLSYLGNTTLIESGEIPLGRSIHQLKIDNVSGLQLNDDLELKGTTPLVLTNGVINVSEGKTISCINAFPAAGSASSYINGAVAISVNGVGAGSLVNFPIGSDGAYRKITIGGLKSSDSNLSTVRVAIVNPSGGTPGTGVIALSAKRRWEMLVTSGTGINYTSVSIDYGSDDGSGIDIIAQSNTLTGTYDAFPEGSSTSSNVTTAIGNYTNTGYFALGSKGILPVELINFNIHVQENRVNLTWQTLSEKNNEKFVIERSFDGKTFIPLISLDGNKTTSSISDYNVYDNHPASGANYYQLLQYDLNGVKHNLGIKVINFSLSGNIRVKAYPNPVTDKLNIDFGNYNMNTAVLSLTDLNGKQLIKKTVSGEEIKNGYVLMINNELKKGLYLLRVEGENLSEKFKIIKN